MKLKAGHYTVRLIDVSDYSDETCGHTRTDNPISLFFYDGGNSGCCTHHCSGFKKETRTSHETQEKNNKMGKTILGVYDDLLAETTAGRGG